MLQRRVEQARLKGADLSVIVVDGNAKPAGRICARPFAEVQHCAALNTWVTHPCSEQPAFKKRRCMSHLTESVEDTEDEDVRGGVVTKHRRSSRLWAGEAYDVFIKMPRLADVPGWWVAASEVVQTKLDRYWKQQEKRAQALPRESAAADVSACKCRTHKEGQASAAQVRQGRCNGWLFAVTSCGFCVHCKPYFGSESLSQRHAFLAEVMQVCAETRVVVHDDACHLRRLTTKYASKSKEALALRMAYPRTKYIVDKFHQKGLVWH